MAIEHLKKIIQINRKWCSIAIMEHWIRSGSILDPRDVPWNCGTFRRTFKLQSKSNVLQLLRIVQRLLIGTLFSSWNVLLPKNVFQLKERSQERSFGYFPRNVLLATFRETFFWLKNVPRNVLLVQERSSTEFQNYFIIAIGHV